jgi:hypothetical protein
MARSILHELKSHGVSVGKADLEPTAKHLAQLMWYVEWPKAHQYLLTGETTP